MTSVATRAAAATPTAETRTRPIRVVLVGPSLDILGGQAVQLARLLEHFRATPEVTVDFLAVNPRLPGPFRALQRVKYVRTVATSIAYFAALLRRVPRYDIVHAFSASYYSYLLAPLPALLVARAYGKQALLNYHSGEADDHLGTWRRTAAPTMRRIPNAIAVPSDYLVAVFRHHGLRSRAIANFVDIDGIPYRERTNLRPIFLSNRNLEPMYNVRCTLEAFEIIQDDFPDARLIVAGDGSERSALEQFVRDHALRNVSFIGRVPAHEMGALYDQADVYLNSSDIDNMPLSIIEAYAAGIPVATTDAGGIPYMVRNEDTGLLVSRGDAAALAAAAIRLLREPGLALQLARHARAECLREYAWPAVERHWVNLYEDLVHGNAPSVT